MRSVQEINSEIAGTETVIAKLEARESEARGRAESAKADSLRIAQKSIIAGSKLPEQCRELEAEAVRNLHEGEACSSITGGLREKLANLRRELAVAEKVFLKEQISKVVAGRSRPIQKVGAAARTLLDAIAELDAADSSIADLLVSLDSGFADLFQRLKEGNRRNVLLYVTNALVGRNQEDLASAQKNLSEVIARAVNSVCVGGEEQSVNAQQGTPVQA
jgi:hypothetical protein